MESANNEIKAYASVSLSGEQWLGEVYVKTGGSTRSLARLFFADFSDADRWARSIACSFNSSDEDKDLFSVFRRTTGEFVAPV